MKRRFFDTALATIILILMGLAPVRGQDAQGPPPDQAGIAEPGVARISLIQGDAATQRGDNGQWAAAVVNTPVVNGDNVSTGDLSRAEVQLDYADVIRLDQHTQVKVADLAGNHLQVQLADGLIDFSILRGAQANVEVDTPNMSVQPTAEGEYRIEVASPTETRVIVRAGATQVSTPQGSTSVNEGQMITIEGTGDDAQFHIDPAPEIDEWDQWNMDRDRTIVSAQSWAHTDQYYTGTEDLDQNGQWVNTPDYGDVWQPNVEEQNPDWAPYRDGSWCDTPNYGWTWVGAEPWGWAPYHYGRWFMWGNRWSWWPGVIAAGIRPLWGPAWVSFLGFGAQGLNWFANLALGGLGGFGRIGWLPLGPLDAFHPWWGRWGRGGYEMAALYRGGRDVGRIGSNWGRAFTNARVRAGMTAVDPRTFASGRIGGRVQPVSLADFRQGRTISGRVPIEPTRESMNASRMAARPSAIPGRSFAQTRFFTGGASRQAGFGGAFGSRGGFSSMAQRPGALSRPGGSFARPAPPAGGSMAPGARGQAQGGWQRFSQAPGSAPRSAFGSAGPRGGFQSQHGFVEARPSGPQARQGGGWQRFSDTGRQPLNLNKPFMNQRAPRSSGGYSNPNPSRGYSAPRNSGTSPYGSRYGGSVAPRSGGYSAPAYRSFSPPRGGSYSAPRNYTYSAPRGGGFSAPRGYSAPRGNFSAPRGGGGSRGGGGFHGFGGGHGGGGHHGGGGGGGGHHGGGGHGRH